MSIDDTNYYIADDETIIKWHITDEGELDYTTYREHDGGRLELDSTDEANIHQILESTL